MDDPDNKLSRFLAVGLHAIATSGIDERQQSLAYAALFKHAAFDESLVAGDQDLPPDGLSIWFSASELELSRVADPPLADTHSVETPANALNNESLLIKGAAQPKQDCCGADLAATSGPTPAEVGLFPPSGLNPPVGEEGCHGTGGGTTGPSVHQSGGIQSRPTLTGKWLVVGGARKAPTTQLGA